MSFRQLISLMLSLLLAAPVPSLGAGESIWSKDARCHELLGALGDFVPKADTIPQEDIQGYRSRLMRVLDQAPAEIINQVFNHYGPSFFGDLYWYAKLSRSNSTVSEALDRNPGIKQFVLDIQQFNRDFPGALWESSDTAKTMRDLLEDQGHADQNTRQRNVRADQLHQRISTLATTVINRSLKEYDGAKLNRGLGQRVIDRIQRFIFPHYKRVVHLVTHGKVQQNQLGLIAAIDGIIMNRGLNRAESLKIQDGERAELNAFLSDTPKQISTVHMEMSEVYGNEHINGVPLREEGVDVYALYKKIKHRDLVEDAANDQREAEAALDKLNEVLAKARRRLNLGERPLSDYVNDELHIRFDEKQRKASERYSAYKEATSERTRVSYTVEERHTRQVYKGTDKDGNAEYETETYYVDRTVIPTYENILTRNFDTGDRFVSGLDSIKRATQDLSERERAYRNSLAQATKFIEITLESYQKLLQDQGQRQARLKDLEDSMVDLKDKIESLRIYANWNEMRVRHQWSYDSYENFKLRNSRLLAALENQLLGLTFTHEILKRELPGLNFSVASTDLSGALNVLKWKMWINYGIKTTITLIVGGTGGFAYAKPEEAQQTIDWMTFQSQQLFQMVAPYVVP